MAASDAFTARCPVEATEYGIIIQSKEKYHFQECSHAAKDLREQKN